MRIPHMLEAGVRGLTAFSPLVYRQSILLVHLCCIGGVLSLDNTVTPVIRDAGGSGPTEMPVRSTARRLVSLSLMSMWPLAQLIADVAQAKVAQNPNMGVK